MRCGQFFARKRSDDNQRQVAATLNKGIKVKQEEEDVALASEGKQEKRKKKDLSKTKCFHCGEMGHYATQCPRRRVRESLPRLR